jgi:DNA-binding transcriptional MocR family regulator
MSVLPESGIISFARGIPAPEFFPADELAEAAQRAFARHRATALNYGPPAGFGPLREWIAAEHGAAPGQIVITPGSYILLTFLVRALLQTPGPVVVEVPSYDRAVSLLRTTGARILPVRRDETGLDFARLEHYLATGERPAFCYLLPTFHNPTGTTLAPADRQRLVDLAIAHDLLLVEDDPYGPLRFDGAEPPSLRSLLVARGAGHLSVFMSSFSKVVAPGLRVGYGVLPEQLAQRVAAVALTTYVSPPLWPQAEIYEFLAGGFLPAHLSRVRGLLRLRRDALVTRLAAGLDGIGQDGAGPRWSHPDGGYFLWLDLPAQLSANDLLDDCERAGVTFVPGPGFFADGGGGSSARLCFSFHSVEEIADGADRLVAAARGRLVGVGAA